MTNQKCLHIFVEGTVQGVGFRYFVQQLANALNIKGWVRNRLDERVEILALGEENHLNAFAARVRVGPSMANVTRVDVEWVATEVEFKRFSIAPTD